VTIFCLTAFIIDTPIIIIISLSIVVLHHSLFGQVVFKALTLEPQLDSSSPRTGIACSGQCFTWNQRNNDKSHYRSGI